MIASFELEGIVSSSIVTLSSDTRTMSGLAVAVAQGGISFKTSKLSTR